MSEEKRLRYESGHLTQEGKRQVMDYVVTAMGVPTPREEIVEGIVQQFGGTYEKAREMWELGSIEFARGTGYTDTQIRRIVEQRTVKILADEESTDGNILRAASLVKHFINDNEEDEDLTDKVRLWQDYIDALTVEQINEFIDQHRKGLFDLKAISEQSLASMIELANKAPTGKKSKKKKR